MEQKAKNKREQAKTSVAFALLGGLGASFYAPKIWAGAEVSQAKTAIVIGAITALVFLASYVLQKKLAGQ